MVSKFQSVRKSALLPWRFRFEIASSAGDGASSDRRAEENQFSLGAPKRQPRDLQECGRKKSDGSRSFGKNTPSQGPAKHLARCRPECRGIQSPLVSVPIKFFDR